MRPVDGVAARLCTRWVRLYTKRLSADVAARRREEMASDLWDHVADAEAADLSRTMVNIEVFGRVLSGMPADISWRWAMRRASHSRRSLSGGLSMRISERSKALTVLARIVMGWYIVMIVIAILESDGAWSSHIEEIVVWLSGLVSLVLGMHWRARWPGLALALITLGAVMPAVMYWLLPFYMPIGALLILNAFISTPRAPRVQDTVSV